MIPNDVVRGGYNPRYLAVLLVIASHAGDNGTCFASNATIAKEAGVKIHMVIEAIRFWEDLGGLSVKRREGHTTILTTRFDFSAKTLPKESEGYAESGIGGMPKVAHLPMPEVAYKEEQVKKNKLRRHNTANTKKDIAPIGAGSLNDILGYFSHKLNDNMNFGNITQRKAMQFLIDKHGYERLKRIIDYCESIRAEPFAPIITTPLQMKNKEAQLVLFWQKQAMKSPNIISI